MISTYGPVASLPPLGAADTGGPVVYVLELARKLALLGYQVDLRTRRFEGPPETETVAARVRFIRMPCGGEEFPPKEYLCHHLAEWIEPALRFIHPHGLAYQFVSRHYWTGIAHQIVAAVEHRPSVAVAAGACDWDEPWNAGD